MELKRIRHEQLTLYSNQDHGIGIGIRKKIVYIYMYIYIYIFDRLIVVLSPLGCKHNKRNK